MQKLKNRSVCPPDPVYFRFVHTEDGFSSTAQTYQAWQQTIDDHCQRNGLERVSMEVAEDQLCNTLPAGWCEGTDPNRPHVDMRFNLRDVWNWATAHLKVLVAGGFVSQTEAERRAKICSGCYMNVSPQGCSGCENVATIFAKDLAGKETTGDRYLQACGVCKCFLKALIWFPLDSLPDEEQYQANFPSFCWRKKNAEATTN